MGSGAKRIAVVAVAVAAAAAFFAAGEPQTLEDPSRPNHEKLRT